MITTTKEVTVTAVDTIDMDRHMARAHREALRLLLLLLLLNPPLALPLTAGHTALKQEDTPEVMVVIVGKRLQAHQVAMQMPMACMEEVERRMALREVMANREQVGRGSRIVVNNTKREISCVNRRTWRSRPSSRKQTPLRTLVGA